MKKKALIRLLSLVLVLALLPISSALTVTVGGEAQSGYGSTAPSALDEVGGGAYTAILDGLLRGEERISLEEFSLDVGELQSLFAQLYYSEAEIFFVSASYSYSKTPADKVVSLSPSYLCEREEIAPLLAEFRAITDGILADAPRGLSPLLRVAYVHDYIATSFVYDTTLTNYDVYSMLKTGTGVCQPYALLARYLLRRLGVETECVTSEALNHEWNVVRLGGSWYHMDITWDDADDTGFVGQVGHSYFLASDEDFASGKHNAAWVSPAPCDDERYDGVFKDVSSRFVFAEGEAYAINGGAISRLVSEAGEMTALQEIDEVWHSYLSPIGWQGTFSGLSYARGVLLYNTESEIRYYDPASGEGGTVVALKTVGGYLYGSAIEGHDLIYALKREPNHSAFQPGRAALLFTVTWMIGGVAHAEEYFYGELPRCKEPTEMPVDTHRLTFAGWDKPITAVKADATYTAVYSSVELYPESAERFVSLVEAAGAAGATMAERFAALSEAVAIASLVNPDYAGVAETRALLPDLVAQYNADAAAFFFAGWVPSR